jgi:hypothetical protein
MNKLDDWFSFRLRIRSFRSDFLCITPFAHGSSGFGHIQYTHHALGDRYVMGGGVDVKPLTWLACEGIRANLTLFFA